MKKYSRYFAFLFIWLLVELLIVALVFLKTVLFEPNWQGTYQCTKWNYACVEKYENNPNYDMEIKCCDKKELQVWKDIKFYAGISGFGLSIFIAILATQNLRFKGQNEVN